MAPPIAIAGRLIFPFAYEPPVRSAGVRWSTDASLGMLHRRQWGAGRMPDRTAARRPSDAKECRQETRVPRRSLVRCPTRMRLVVGLAIAASLTVAETLVLYPLKHVVPADALVVVYLLGVVMVSIIWGFWLATATSAVSALAFDYFHLTPAFDFALAPHDGLVVGIFLVIALSTISLGDLARSGTAAAAQRRALAEQQAARRRVVGTLAPQAASPSEVVSAVAEEIVRCLNVDISAVWRYAADNAITLLATHSKPGSQYPPVGECLSLEGDNLAAMALRSGRPARLDTVENSTGPAIARIREMGVRAGVGALILVDGRVWGLAVAASTRQGKMPADSEERISDFADLVATVITNDATRAELIASRARIVAAGDDARRRLERDLHDGAQQRLVSLGLQLRMAEASIPDELQPLRVQLSEIMSGLTDVSAELREISRGIHPAILSDGGLAAALKTLARRSCIPVSLDVAIERRVPESVEAAAYYVVAEALTNAAKHARASAVYVRVHIHDDDLRILIRDDGKGGADPSKGSGIVGLKDRVEALGGHLQISSPSAAGTTLYIDIPLQR